MYSALPVTVSIEGIVKTYFDIPKYHGNKNRDKFFKQTEKAEIKIRECTSLDDKVKPFLLNLLEDLKGKHTDRSFCKKHIEANGCQ